MEDKVRPTTFPAPVAESKRQAVLVKTTENVATKKPSESILGYMISLGVKGAHNRLEKIKQNLEAIEAEGYKKLVIVPVDTLQVNSLRYIHPEKSEEELRLIAFEDCVDFLKKIAPLVLQLKIPFEILPWHKIQYAEFQEENVTALFVQPLEITLNNIDSWAKKIRAVLKPNGLKENPDYEKCIADANLLYEEDREFRGEVNASTARFKRAVDADIRTIEELSAKAASDNPPVKRNETNCARYVVHESGFIKMVGERKLFDATVYATEFNPAMKYVLAKFAPDLPHYRFTYPVRQSAARPNTHPMYARKKREQDPKKIPNSWPPLGSTVASPLRRASHDEQTQDAPDDSPRTDSISPRDEKLKAKEVQKSQKEMPLAADDGEKSPAVSLRNSDKDNKGVEQEKKSVATLLTEHSGPGFLKLPPPGNELNPQEAASETLDILAKHLLQAPAEYFAQVLFTLTALKSGASLSSTPRKKEELDSSQQPQRPPEQASPRKTL